MVTIINWKSVQPKDGKPFNALVLEGEIELVKSKSTGNVYATAKKCQITSTFNEAMCKKLIGKSLPGKIVKVQTDEYNFTIPDTGEVIQLDYMYRYEAAEAEEAVFEKELMQA